MDLAQYIEEVLLKISGDELNNYNKRTIGTKYEEAAIDHLKAHGYDIITKNFRCKIGEIDIIAKESGYLTFIEVKYRSSLKSGYPHEAINNYKINKIINTAKYYMLNNNISFDKPCRFDVVTILDQDINIIKNAFEL